MTTDNQTEPVPAWLAYSRAEQALDKKLEEKKANIVKRWTIDRNVSYLWLALLMDDKTLHIVNPGKDIKYIYTPASADPEPRKWVLDDSEAVILDDGTCFSTSRMMTSSTTRSITR